jgi:hypothetical protein
MDEGSREIKASMPGVHRVASFLFPLDIHHQKKYIYMFDTYLFFRTIQGYGFGYCVEKINRPLPEPVFK